MARQGIAYNWDFLGAVLANENAEIQATFFKNFVKEMESWDCTTFQKMTQLCWINEKLTSREKELLGMLGYEENNDAKKA